METSQEPGRPELTGMTVERASELVGPILEDAGEPSYRLKQLLVWIFQRPVERFEDMTDLPQALRQRLSKVFVLHPLEADTIQQSTDGTRKYLWKRERGEPIESVWIPEEKRQTFCISTQAGCAVACTFCATGFGGFNGQLAAAEIVDQVLRMRLEAGVEPSNLVFMGMGEPLLNFENVLEAIEILCQPRQVGLGARRITVSTVGVPKRIVELGQIHPQVKLAVSLHAARESLRDEIIPLNRRYPLSEILAAVREHQKITGKKITFEYILLPGVNDAGDDVEALGRVLRGIRGSINLLGFNPFPGSAYAKPRVDELVRFRSRLEKRFAGPVTIRRSRGEDIQGACGQLSLHAKGDSRA